MSVIVVTDSSAVIPGAWREGLPLHIVSLQMAWPNGDISEGDAPYAELAQRLARGEEAPKTAAPSPGTYEALFRKLLEDADSLLVVSPAIELSSTYANAVLAARSAGEDRVYVLDAKTAAAGQGLVAVAAARAARAGGDIDGVLAHTLDVASRVQIWATLRQLDFLRRSGRVPAVAAIGVGALGLQPVIRYTSGSPTPVGVTRSAERAVERVYRAWRRSFAGGALQLVAFHSARETEAADLEARVRQRAPDAETAVAEVAASLGSHVGPGLLGLAWLCEDRS